MNSHNRRPTIHDVAAQAGVSHQTVSRVINGNANVAKRTREHVLAAIRELDYVPNPLARGLIGNRTHSIGLVTADISDYFFSHAAAGAEKEARKRGYYLMIASVEDTAREDEEAYLRLMLERRVEGLIVASPLLPEAGLTTPRETKTRIPVVAIGSSRASSFPVVDVNNRDGGLQATSLLIREGHRRIATLAGPDVWRSTTERLEGYREALHLAGVADDPSLVESCPDWSIESGRAAAARLLAGATAFTAIFAHSDLLALGAIAELRRSGLHVPDDVSVVGYDDIPVASVMDPPLTTVSQPTQDVGAVAARLVLDTISAEAPEEALPSVSLLPARLVVRESVAPPRHR